MLWFATPIRRVAVVTMAVALVTTTATACISDDDSRKSQNEQNQASQRPPSTVDLGDQVREIVKGRGLSDADIQAALKTYMPSGTLDDYVMFASGGHSGQVLVIGMPSMRILKEIAVFTPESWQGWGFGSKESEEILAGGNVNGKEVHWGDTHHPALSETNGVYDGQWLFINDKANGRLAVIDLRDFATKQIVKNPLLNIDHGGTMVTPNTEYIIEGSQYAAPLSSAFAPLSEYGQKYRGQITFWKFDRNKGRIDPAQSFALELPPYGQDLCDAGKGPSDGWAFCNSFNVEQAVGAIEDGKPPLEAGASRGDMDYLHAINWRKAAELVQQGKTQTINGMRVLPLDVSSKEGVLYFVPEPKSPHGVDVTPGGEYMVVAGKLDPHVSVYSFQKLQDAIKKGTQTKDEYGVPVLAFGDTVEKQVEIGLGPLHTQFDSQGYAYTSLFLESAVARWSLGGPYRKEGWMLEGKIPVNYNVGHIATVGGDTAQPDGKYLVSMNKWALDRFVNVGPLLPQNFQLIDIAQSGEKMQLLYDMPIGMAEPHYAQIIRADKLQPWKAYPETPWNERTQSKDPDGPMPGKERVERRGNTVEVWMTSVRSHFNPEKVQVKKGDHVIWHITNFERGQDATHGFALSGYNISLSLEPGKSTTIEFDADQAGTFSYYCTEFCSALHLEMAGYFLVEP